MPSVLCDICLALAVVGFLDDRYNLAAIGLVSNWSQLCR